MALTSDSERHGVNRWARHTGEHQPIISPDMFTAVRALLAQRKNLKRDSVSKSQSLLGGLIFDDQGNRMTPVHASKGKVRYRYHQSWVLGQGQKDKAGSRISMPRQIVWAR